MSRTLPILTIMMLLASIASASDILTPAGYGNVTSYNFAGKAFDAQPTWSGSDPTGGDATYTNFLSTSEVSKVCYIDLGTDWADWRIEETWTKYMQYRNGGALAYTELWWDDDIDAVNDGVTENTLNFVTQGNNTNTFIWTLDVDTSASPVTPQGRYLLLRVPASAGTYNNNANELAFVGYIESNVAPTVDAGSDDTIALPSSANLDGTVSDDDLPDPPGSYTLEWTKQSGPGTVTFGNAYAEDTTATFSTSGTYVLRLTADDSALTAYDEVTITVLPASDILTPAGYGNVTSYNFAGKAFDAQPIWSGSDPTGGDATYANFLSTSDVSRVSYIDLGTDWADWRIEETWTKYMQYRNGGALAYTELWWDDDIDAVNDGVTENTLNFVTQGNNTNTFIWTLDVDTSASPVTPQGRYLLLRVPASAGTYNNNANELAFVGYIDGSTPPTNQAPSVDAGADDNIQLPTDSVSLDGTVSDDGLPNPPGSYTVEWTMQSGPGTVTFGNAYAVDTTATFSIDGTYVLRLTADDGSLTDYDEVTIAVFSATDILTPAGYGNVTSYNFAGKAFDAQPTWSGSDPTGGDNTYANFLSTGDVSKVSYIDLGSDWANWRIEQTWTKYMQYRDGGALPYAELWWDNDIDTVNDGTTENTLNFVTQGNNTNTFIWTLDVDTSASPVTPQGRYLLLRVPASIGTYNNNANELAFVGYTDSSTPPTNQAPIVNAGSDDAITLPTNSVSLDGSINDDGLPDPPGSYTVEWTKQSGPGTVTFGNAYAVDTTATFSTSGTYVLRLTADDGALTAYDELTVVVNPDPNPPVMPTLTLADLEAFNYAQLTLVDEVDCGDPNDPHTVLESSTGVSQIQTLLNESCRVLPNTTGAGPSYFAYRLGANSNLEAGKGYVLVIEYPEDLPRTITVGNRGCETIRSFHTGTTVGDAFDPPYEHSRSTSMHFGLSLDYRRMEQLFHLHDRYPGIFFPRDAEYPRDDEPEDGFIVMISQYAEEDCPLSNGAAVSRIALYEAPASWSSYAQTLNLPSSLPRRHLFWREEMSDACINNTPAGVTDDTDWYEYKARLMKFLGMNTFCRDLLEFGHNQGWDSTKYGGDNWYNTPASSNRWENILYRLATEGYGFDYMPYYEYAGSTGLGEEALGVEKRAKPLGGGDDYTNIAWCERFNVDITDPDTLTDAQYLLDCTITELAAVEKPLSLDPAGTWINRFQKDLYGYIDFGPDWDDIRITQCWTRSTQFRGGDASPYQAAYWHDDPTDFSGGVVPPGAIAENTINFITQPQLAIENNWTRDVNLAPASAITPSARYLVMQAADPLSEPRQAVVVGWIEDGGAPEIQTIPIAGAGSANGHDMSPLFDNQPEFNTTTSDFVGAWFRQRPSHLPVGFSDATLTRFANEANGGVPITQTQLQTNSTLLQDYYDWWLGRRRDFFEDLRDYLRTNVSSDAVVLFTWDTVESGSGIPGHPRVVTDDMNTWANITVSRRSYDDAMTGQLHLQALTLEMDPVNWSDWAHSSPDAYASDYANADGVMMTHTFNKLYTVSDPDTWDEFQTASGLAAIRHYCLNEDAMKKADDTTDVGYFVTDTERAGPYCMIGEARAMAHGDPYYFGYLASNSFNRCFPGYVRDFNANYLALPAMTSVVEANAANDAEVIVRSISTPSNGTWVAIVNTSLEDKTGVVVTLPVSGTVTDAVTGDPISVSNGTITLDMWPARLKSIHIAN